MSTVDSKAVMLAKIEAGAPDTLDELYHRVHTPGGMSTPDLMRFVEFQSKVLGLLQNDKSSNFVPVTIQFINGGEMQIAVEPPQPDAQPLLDVTDAVIKSESAPPEEEFKPEPVDWLSALEAELNPEQRH